MDNFKKRIHDTGIIPVVALENAENGASLAKALCDGGLPIAEVSYRTDAAHDSIAEMKKACPEMLVGAGTVLTKENVDSALNAGAGFIVTSGFDPDIARTRLVRYPASVENALASSSYYNRADGKSQRDAARQRPSASARWSTGRIFRNIR